MSGKSAISVAVKVSDDKDGWKRLTIDADGFRKIMTENVKVAKELQRSVFGIAATSTAINSVNNAIGQLSSPLSSLTAESKQFGKAMREANTMAGKDAAGFGKLKDQVADLAKEIPLTRDLLAQGLYQTISNGVPEDNWMTFLQTSARSAVGGLADINQVVGVTSTVIKNYGLEWEAAAEIQDKIQLTAKNGVTSFEQLAAALPRVTGNAATLGVTIDELLATFATLTGVSGNTAEVSTQLAAIFTALVKPRSEATKMADTMGIQFDAAAVKAEGGFQNFLAKLNESIHAYAQSSGVLEQEVYAKLFGSAESLRALIPLQGELADKFSENVANMENSVGTMDAAFNEMNSTGESTMQRWKNAAADFFSWFTESAAVVEPFVSFGAKALSTGANVMILVTAFKQLNAEKKKLIRNTKTAIATKQGLIGNIKKTTQAIRILTVAEKGSAASAKAMTVAVRGILIASGVGVAIVALTAIISAFSDSADDAADSVKELDEAADEYKRAAADAKVQIDKDIKSLEELIKAHKEDKEVVERLNKTYGAYLGTHEKVSSWYDTLRAKSKAYIKQIGLEAKAMSLRNQLAEVYTEKDVATDKMAERRAAGVDSRGRIKRGSVMVKDDDYEQAQEAFKAAEEKEAKLQKEYDRIISLSEKNMKELGAEIAKESQALDINKMNWQQCTDAIAANEKARKNTLDPQKTKALLAEDKLLRKHLALVEKKQGLESKSKSGNASSKKKLVANPTTKADYQNNRDILFKKLTGEDTPEQQELIKDIKLYDKKLAAIELQEKAATRPDELNTLQDISKELDYQRALRQTVAEESIAGVDAEIERLENLREAKERAGHVMLPVEKIETRAQLNKEVSHYNWLLENGTEKERIFAKQHLNDLAKVEKAWDRVLDDLNAPGDISTLKNIEDLDEAIGRLDARIKTAASDEIAAYQRTRLAFENKRKALQRGIEIPTAMQEVDEINKLTGREYKIRVKGMGFDDLTSKIDELRHTLDDIENPVTEAQRKDIESLIAVYEKWRREGIDAFGTFRNGWDSVKGIGGGVESLTEVLQGNGDAWQSVTGIVDGFIQIYEGITAIVGIINMLAMATGIFTAKEEEKAVASTVAAAAQGTEIGTSEAAAAAKIPVIIANKAATASYMELASAMYFAAHASIPFAGFGIASGFVAAATAIVQSIGVMPFADGGIVSGPTLGLIGEYAGASNNPEVVAPLDKLRSLLNPVGQPVIIGGTIRLRNRELVVALANETRIASKSGRRTNIKI